MYQNIPSELKSLPNWCLWKYEDIGATKSTKVPYSPNGKHADVNRPETWCSFDEAVAAAKDYSGIGFVFTNSGYAFIDLDESLDQATLARQIKIHSEFDSYSEVSPSGKGLHIIVKGSVPSGRRRSSIEIYSSQRYATMTGQVYNNKPIKECQSLLTQLWEQMGSGAPATLLYKGDEKETRNDAEIIKQARLASNGEKFVTLLEGRWNEIYASQSEADFAFINIISFYTQNRAQIERIFHASPLGQRPKAKRKDYLAWMVNKSFDRMLPPIDFDGFKIALEQKLAPKPVAQIPAIAASKPALSLPPGLLGELAQFIYAAAPRPVPEIALAAAIGLMAGICGRAYNISGTGLNQYVLVLAKTGRGKESAASGIDKLMNAVKMQVPTSTRFRGPGIINSGQALVRYLSTTSNCFVSILGEFGITIERVSSPYANSADKMLYQMLLDLYNKSGHGQTFQPSIYSKKEENVGITESPALTILGESTHKIFYNTLNEDMISAGLLPRFLIIEYNGDRVELNENHNQVEPSFQIVERFAALIANAEMIMHSKKVINIKCDELSTKLLRDFDRSATYQINSAKDDTIAELWNRAHMKALRLAGLIACGINMSEPLVISEYANWAINIVQNDIRALSSKFESGEIGKNSNEIKQQKEIIRMIKDFLTKDWEYVGKYCQGKNMRNLYNSKIIPYGYLNKRLSNLAPFNFNNNSTNVLKTALQNMIDSDIIREVDKKELTNKCGTAQRSFVLSNVEILND